jgi:S-adenosylmethionine decarboxylase proenzyme
MDHIISMAAGNQWVGDFTNCKCDLSLLQNARELETACEQIVAASGLMVMGRVFHQFQPAGATGLFLLAESHLAIHTWPERTSVAIDLYVCNVEENNAAKAAGVFKELLTLFSPGHYAHQLIQRGGAV